MNTANPFRRTLRMAGFDVSGIVQIAGRVADAAATARKGIVSIVAMQRIANPGLSRLEHGNQVMIPESCRASCSDLVAMAAWVPLPFACGVEDLDQVIAHPATVLTGRS